MKRKAANGMGTWSYDKDKDLYTFRVTVEGLDGGLVRKAFSGRTQDIADEKYQKWKAEREDTSLLDPDMLLTRWADAWYEEYSAKVEKSTAASYEYTKRIIVARLGKMKVCDIRAVHVEKFIAALAGEGYSVSQCTKCRAMLGQMLRKAEANELIRKNPVPLADRANYRRLGSKQGQHKKDAYDADEVALLIEDLPDTRVGHSIRLMIGVGLSVQEILGVSKFDIPADGSEIGVHRAVKTGKGGKMYIGDVKAEKRDRVTEVPEAIRASAIFLREHAAGYILQGRGDMPMHPSTYRKFYKAAVKQVEGVRLLSPHCCRHTYISHLEDNGVDFAVIQDLAGQSEKSSTISYIHPQSPAKKQAVGLINELLTGKKENANAENGMPTGMPTQKIDANTKAKKC